MILIDTNILIHTKNPSSPDHARAIADVTRLIEQGEDIVVCPQVLRECYVVMTRPSTANGLGLDTATAKQEIESIQSTYTFMVDDSRVFDEFKHLVHTFSVSGRNAHDTNIAAFAIANSINGILTYNVQDFQRFNGLIDIHS